VEEHQTEHPTLEARLPQDKKWKDKRPEDRFPSQVGAEILLERLDIHKVSLVFFEIAVLEALESLDDDCIDVNEAKTSIRTDASLISQDDSKSHETL